MSYTICKHILLTCVLVVLVCNRQVAGKLDVTIERVSEPVDLAEGPHWDHRTQKLFFVDVYGQRICRLDTATGAITSIYLDNGTVSTVVPVDDSTDQLIAGIGRDLVLVEWDGEENETEVETKVLCSLDTDSTVTRTNDGKVDSSGRFWLGTMAEEINGQIAPDKGTLYLIDTDFEPKKVISPVTISNGIAWNTEDDTFYYIDSGTRQVFAYDYDPQDGKISNKRAIFDLNKTDLDGVLDGMTIDTNGNLWIALYGGHHIINVNPRTGELLRKIKFPAENVTSCTFGGPLLDILYVTTSRHGLTESQKKTTPHAGSVFAVKGLDVRGNLANAFQMN